MNLREPLHEIEYSIALILFLSRSYRRDKGCQTIPKWRFPRIFGLGYHANDRTSCELTPLRYACLVMKPRSLYRVDPNLVGPSLVWYPHLLSK